MEKLIELLNEYEKEIKSNYFWGISYGKLECSVGGTDHDLYDDEVSMVIKSKEYGFIKWLVENEKIKWDEKFYLEDDKGLFGTYECLLMQLAIQDNPIEFLVSILK